MNGIDNAVGILLADLDDPYIERIANRCLRYKDRHAFVFPDTIALCSHACDGQRHDLVLLDECIVCIHVK